MADAMQQGYLIIADISGYTAYLMGTELTHAQDILSKLIQTILDAYQPPIELVELEGDAVYVYLPGTVASGQAVLDAIEGAYFAFARQRDSIGQLAPCVCAACRNVPMLDLKFVVHFGYFAVQRLAGRVKPIGPDVILVHRLLKNHVAEVMGLHAYVFFTDAALTRMGLDVAALGIRRHGEEYEHLGAVEGGVLDLVARWEQERALRRLRLDAGAARCWQSVDLPAPPEVVWAYLTRPVLRRDRACARRARRHRWRVPGAGLATVRVLHRQSRAGWAARAPRNAHHRADAHPRRHAGRVVLRTRRRDACLPGIHARAGQVGGAAAPGRRAATRRVGRRVDRARHPGELSRRQVL
jgi:hypothetical protein